MAAGIVGARRRERGRNGWRWSSSGETNESWDGSIAEALWPRGGWARAFQYVQHRLRRLPGTPEQIARGIFAGAVTVFTPLFGLHFVVAAILAKIMRGSILASLLATFIGNPLTYVPIAIISLQTGPFPAGNLTPGRGGRIRSSRSSAARRATCGTTSSPSSRPSAPSGTSWRSSTGMSSSPGWWAG
jgi:hypothetical protein